MKKLIRLIKANILFLLFLVVIIVVAGFYISKKYVAKSSYIYVQVKVGQGLWWASIERPSFWLIRSLTMDKNNNLSGDGVKLISLNYYPSFQSIQGPSEFTNQFDVYVTLRIPVTKDGGGQYYFNRNLVSIGAPIDIQLPVTQFSGTIVNFSKMTLNNSTEERTVFLSKAGASQDEFQNVNAGDYYFDGQNKVFIVEDKSYQDGTLIIKAKIALTKSYGHLLFGENEVINLNQKFDFITNKAIFYDFVVDRIE